MSTHGSNFPGTIDDALRYRFLRHHMRDDRARAIFSRAGDQDEFQRLVDHWIAEDWHQKHAGLARDYHPVAMLSVFRRDLLRIAAWGREVPA